MCLSRGGGGWRPKKTVQNCSACVRGLQSHWSRGALHETLYMAINRWERHLKTMTSDVNALPPVMSVLGTC